MDGLLYHIAPKIIARVAKTVKNGATETVGNITISKYGISIPTGILAWRKDNGLPFNRVGAYCYSGELHVSDTQNSKVKTNLALRATWNAVIFEGIIKAVQAAVSK